ncbi:hypothetical protein DFR67_114156 [Williamsia limnetica]|uniref:Uncharacterized protein n=1 Tax=Williamsia limnetica TaxID=882452 RepID=A0A318RWD9_WILLI|nr:hypothetical protein DFR67_114156 [Williamsia limnetica]
MEALPGGLGAQIYAQGTLAPLERIATAPAPADASQDEDADEDDPDNPSGADDEGEKRFPKSSRAA